MSKILINLVKMTISLFPPSWPPAIYNSLVKVTFLKTMMMFVLKRITPTSADIPEGKIIFDPEDPIMASWLSLGQYEPEMVALFQSSIEKGMTVVDIGANLGYFTVISSHRVGPEGKVFAFEPDPHNFSLLQKNISTNEFRNVTASQIALSDRSGTRELFFGDNNTTHSFSDKRGKRKSETVTTDTLDNILKADGSPRVDLIKMDIEGAEPVAFEGMKETLSNNPKLIVFFEFYPNAIKRLGCDPITFLEDFRKLGFTISVIDENAGQLITIHDVATFTNTFPKKDWTRNMIAYKVLE